jgi:hypothetical protein
MKALYSGEIQRTVLWSIVKQTLAPRAPIRKRFRGGLVAFQEQTALCRLRMQRWSALMRPWIAEGAIPSMSTKPDTPTNAANTACSWAIDPARK